ncbi:hypothetical protein KAU34_03000, partial [candidate division WOR-3 bacterium]|nr:hypothetical protein [candidate division WOR-3 bacterium]
WARFAGPGNTSSQNWSRQTDESHSGSASAGIKYSGTNRVDRFLTTKKLNLKSFINTELVFWSRDNWASYYEYHGIWASTGSQTNSADYVEVINIGPTAEDTWQVYTVNLSSYDGSDSVYFAFRYNELDGTDWWIDDIVITGLSQGNSGIAKSPPVVYTDFPVCTGWEKALWSKATGSDSIGLQIEYLNIGSWTLIPDPDLPGNSSGFFTATANGEVDISGLDTTTYDTLRLVATFIKKSSEAATDPSLLDWEIRVITSSDILPPQPFSLLSPPDSTVLSNPRPTFIWESTVDNESGLKDYRVYIESILRHTGTDTFWTADYDLDEGYNDWYVVAYDSANNSRTSNETWTVIIDTTSPSTVNLISPANNDYLSNTTVNFIWHEANDNVSGIDHYVLQYAFDSGFTQGLIETTLTDTVCVVTLSDTIYYWHVRAVDVASNEGLYSSTWQFEVDTQVPTAPVLNSPIGGIWLNNTSVNFDWSTVFFTAGKDNNKFLDSKEPESTPFSTPVCYILQVDTTTSFTSPMVIDTYTTNSATISLNEDFYYWRIMAYDLAGNQGPFASHESFGVDITEPAIESTTVWTDTTYIGPFEIRTKVSDNLAGLDSVLLYYMRDEDPDWIMEVMHASGDWFTDTIPAVSFNNDSVRYYIRAIDNSTNEATDPDGAPSIYYGFISILLGTAESVKTPAIFNFKVNSFVKGKATFKLNIPQRSRISLKVYDITGRIISEPISG